MSQLSYRIKLATIYQKKIPEEELEEITAATHVPHLRQDIDTIITEIEMDDEDFEKIAYIFRLYGIPLKPVASGIEIYIREKEPFPYRKKKKSPSCILPKKRK